MAWHEAYEDPTSSLSRRRDVVRSRLREALAAVDADSPRLLSLCSGDGSDLIPVLATVRRAVRATMVEYDTLLAGRARDAAAAAGLSTLEVRQGDAGDPAVFDDVLPVDVLMLCGIFGNVEHATVRNTVAQAPCMLAPGGWVIWTRGGSDPDRRPEVRRWFEEAGLPEATFDGAPEPYGVGVNRLPLDAPASPALSTERLFTFV